MDPVSVMALGGVLASVLGLGVGYVLGFARVGRLEEKPEDSEDSEEARWQVVSVEKFYDPGRGVMRVGEKLSYVVGLRRGGEEYRVRVETSTVTGTPLGCTDLESGMGLSEVYEWPLWTEMQRRAEGVVRGRIWETASMKRQMLLSPTGYVCASCDWRDGEPLDDGLGGQSCPWCDSLVFPREVV